MDITTQPALETVREILGQCGLPADDIEPGFLPCFVVAREGDRDLGVAGCQVFGASALVRSVAVRPDGRARGTGAQLLAAVERVAIAHGATRLFLLTHDAQEFFARHGYVAVSRCAAPAEIQGCGQFESACCGAATFMAKEVAG